MSQSESQTQASTFATQLTKIGDIVKTLHSDEGHLDHLQQLHRAAHHLAHRFEEVETRGKHLLQRLKLQLLILAA